MANEESELLPDDLAECEEEHAEEDVGGGEDDGEGVEVDLDEWEDPEQVARQGAEWEALVATPPWRVQARDGKAKGQKGGKSKGKGGKEDKGAKGPKGYGKVGKAGKAPAPPRGPDGRPPAAPAAPNRPGQGDTSGAPSEREVFIEQKRQQSTRRDTACRAICRIKHGLRQLGAQEDGRAFVPEDWDDVFKPLLGSYLKFLMGRPDQFRVLEGAAPGLFTVENVAPRAAAAAPEWGKGAGSFGKGKGKGKGKEKGKMKGKEKGKEKGKGKTNGKAPFPAQPGATWGKGAQAGKGRAPAQGPAQGPAEAAAPRPAAARPPAAEAPRGAPREAPAAPLPRAARLLAEAAREELLAEETDEVPHGAAEEGEEGEPVHEVASGFDETFVPTAEEEEEEAAGHEPALEEGFDDAGAATADEAVPDEDAAKHGSLIRNLLGGGLLAGGLSKRPRLV